MSNIIHLNEPELKNQLGELVREIVVMQKWTHKISRIRRPVQIGKAYDILHTNVTFADCRKTQYKI